MRRRAFLAMIAGAAAAAPLAARAQSRNRPPRIGVLTQYAEGDAEGRARLEAFLSALRALGWNDGGNVEVEVRWYGDDMETARRHALDLVRLAPDAIVVSANPALTVLRPEAGAIPIVMVSVSAPVESGFVASMARPRGNITGFANLEPSMGAKWLQTLKEIAPAVARVLVLRMQTASHAAFWRSLEAAAPGMGVVPTVADVASGADIDRAFASFEPKENGGLVVLPHPIANANRNLIIGLAARHRMPAIYSNQSFATAGGLVALGADQLEQFRGAARYVDRILKGSKPGDLPVEGPTKFELIVNLKTAKALGIAIPQSLLLRADEVIE